MLLLSSSSSTFSVAFLLALLVANQLVDARGFAVKSELGSGTEVDAETKEGIVWTDGPMSMAMSINFNEGIESTPVVGGEEKAVGKCMNGPWLPFPEDFIKKCVEFGEREGCKVSLDCKNDGNCTCCCKE